MENVLLLIGLIFLIEGLIAFFCSTGYLLLNNYKSEIRFLKKIVMVGGISRYLGVILIFISFVL